MYHRSCYGCVKLLLPHSNMIYNTRDTLLQVYKGIYSLDLLCNLLYEKYHRKNKNIISVGSRLLYQQSTKVFWWYWHVYFMFNYCINLSVFWNTWRQYKIVMSKGNVAIYLLFECIRVANNCIINIHS